MCLSRSDRSGTAKVLAGVSQRSILGPLLLLIYIDEINAVSLSHECSRVVYADDVQPIIIMRCTLNLNTMVTYRLQL